MAARLNHLFYPPPTRTGSPGVGLCTGAAELREVFNFDHKGLWAPSDPALKA